MRWTERRAKISCRNGASARSNEFPRRCRIVMQAALAHTAGAEVTKSTKANVVARQFETTEQDLMHSIFPHPILRDDA